MIIILEDSYLGNIKTVKTIFIGVTEGTPCLTMKYVDDEGGLNTFTSKAPKREMLLTEFKLIVQQIKAQDKAFIDQAFEDTVLK